MATNSITINGNLTKDAELFTTKTGRKKASFSIAHNYKEQEEQKTMFVNIEAWDSQKNPLDILVKGKPITVKGFIKPVEFTKKDGTIVKTFVVIVMEVEEIETEAKKNK